MENFNPFITQEPHFIYLGLLSTCFVKPISVSLSSGKHCVWCLAQFIFPIFLTYQCLEEMKRYLLRYLLRAES